MKSSSIKKNAALNIIKQICAIVFPLITFPYAVRVLGVRNYGLVNYTSSVVAYYSLFAALGLQNYGVREGARVRDDKSLFSKLANQLFTINIITVIVSSILLSCLLIFCEGICKSRSLVLIQSMVIPLSLIGCEWINIVFEDYVYITIRYILIQILSITAMFIFVRDSSDYMKYAAIMTFAQAGGGIFNLFYIRKHYVRYHFIRKDIGFRTHIKPLLVLFGVTLSSYVYINADTTMIGLIRGETEVGLYGGATKIYNLVKMVINALVITIIPRLNAYLGAKDYLNYNKLIKKSIRVIISLVVPSTIGLFLLAENILEFVCGKEYISAANSLRILSFALLTASLSYLFSSGVLVANKKERYFLLATIVSSVINIALNFIFIPWMGYTGAAITTLISEICVFGATLFEARKHINVDKDNRWTIDVTIGGGVVALVCIITRMILSNSLVILIVSVVLGFVGYSLVFIGRKNTDAWECISYVQMLRRRICH